MILDDKIFGWHHLAWVKNESVYLNFSYHLELCCILLFVVTFDGDRLLSYRICRSSLYILEVNIAACSFRKENLATMRSVLWWFLCLLPLVSDGFKVTNSFKSDLLIAESGLFCLSVCQNSCILLEQKKNHLQPSRTSPHNHPGPAHTPFQNWLKMNDPINSNLVSSSHSPSEMCLNPKTSNDLVSANFFSRL